MARNDGLSTANFMSGAMQGYNFMQGIENNRLRKEEIQHQRGLRDADEARRVESHRANMQDVEENRVYRKSEETRRAESHAANMQNAEENRGYRKSGEARMAESHKANMQTNQQQQELLRRNFRKLDEEDELKLKHLVARKMIALQNNGLDWTPENQKSLEEYGRSADPEYLLAPETGAALDTVKRVLSGDLNMNDPTAIQAYNRLINVQRGASDGRTVSINRMVPAGSGQGVHLGLNVKNADGSEYDNGVLTQNRSADPRDPVQELTMDELMEVMGAVEQTRGALSNPQMAKAFVEMYGPQSEGTGSGSMPAKAQLHQYVMKQFPGISKEDAWSMANSSPENQSSWTLKLASLIAESEGIPVNEALEKATSKWQEMYGATGGRLAQSSSQNANNNSGPADNKSAPTAAIEALKKNPDTKDQFLAKYGYLPQ